MYIVYSGWFNDFVQYCCHIVEQVDYAHYRYLNRQYAKTRKTNEVNTMPDYQNFAMYIQEPETKEIGSVRFIQFIDSSHG